MATKTPPPTTKTKSVKPGTPQPRSTMDAKKKFMNPSDIAPPIDLNAKRVTLKSGEVPPMDPNASPIDPNALPPPPPPPPIYRPWLKIIRPPWEKPPPPPPPQPKWKIFHPEMLKKYKLPFQVEFQDGQWEWRMLEISMKKKYPKSVGVWIGCVEVTHELHPGSVQVYLQPLEKSMPDYPECQKLQFSTNKPY